MSGYDGSAGEQFSSGQVIVYVKKKSISAVSKKEQSRLQSELGREVFRHGLLELCGLEGEREIIGKTSFGKPYLIRHPEIHYNISHSGSVAVCAFASCPVGVDIQKKVPVSAEKMARRFFSAKDMEVMLHSDDPEDTFFRIWTREESYAKWEGRGLPDNLGCEKKEGWCFEFVPEEGYCGAVWVEKETSVRICLLPEE
ncbi:MAG: 4'-phosphopantetheinyl transferase family protein [Fusicatenibacter sp.]|nr:4'-phosphopantetheinyl transferase superfamily protein [Fusicatenibacter sp.]